MKKAFTLIELLVVVLIIGILSAIALPQYRKAVMKARFVQLKTMAVALANAQEAYYLANGKYSARFDELDINTPAYTQSSTTTSSESRTFSWGSCGLTNEDNQYGAYVSCSTSGYELGYFVWMKNQQRNEAGKHRCRAGSTDLTSLENALCKAETGKATGSSDGAFAFYWDY